MERITAREKRMSVIILVAVLTAVFGFAAFSDAALVSYQFSGTVTKMDSQLSGFPTVLQGIQVGDSVVGSYSYDAATPPSTNSFPSYYGLATFYQVPNTFSLTINSTSIPIGGSKLAVFVWNDDSGKDGFKVQNTLSGGLPYYLNFGAYGGLPSTTFSDESLPTSSIPGTLFGLYNSALSATYLEATFGTLTPSNPVPLPPSLFLLAPGLVGLVIARRKYKR